MDDQDGISRNQLLTAIAVSAGIFLVVGTGLIFAIFTVINSVSQQEDIPPIEDEISVEPPSVTQVETATIVNTSAGSNDIIITAEIADTAEERAQGLMFRESLPPDRGMLFIFEQPQQVSFWMKDTFISLDIIFIDEDFQIVNIARETEPLQTNQLYPSDGEVLYVLEVNAGFSDEYNYSVGDELEIIFPQT
jgi:hypothetical protein